MLADILTYILYGSLILMLLPPLFYTLIYNKLSILWEVLIGFPAYLYYLPT